MAARAAGMPAASPGNLLGVPARRLGGRGCVFSVGAAATEHARRATGLARSADETAVHKQIHVERVTQGRRDRIPEKALLDLVVHAFEVDAENTEDSEPLQYT